MSDGLAEARTTRGLRRLLLVGIVLNLVLIAVSVLLYTPLLAQRGGLVYVLEPVVLLVVYAGIVLAATANSSPRRAVALRTGFVMGLLTGTMWIVNLALETFAEFSGPASLLATAPLLLGAFALWGAAAGRSAWQTNSIPLGILAAVWGAMICVLITVTFGFILTYTSLPRLEHNLVTDPDFVRSRWEDLHAFAIANTFDAGFSHLLGALIVGIVVGTVGSLIGILISRWTQPHAQR